MSGRGVAASRGRRVADPAQIAGLWTGSEAALEYAAHLEEFAERLDTLVAAGVPTQVQLLHVRHRLERLHERIQAVRIETVATQIDLRDGRVALALLGNHLDARALHLSATAIEYRVLGVVGLDPLQHVIRWQDLEGGLPPLARQRLLEVGVHVLICAKVG